MEKSASLCAHEEKDNVHLPGVLPLWLKAFSMSAVIDYSIDKTNKPHSVVH